jgi:hypothetical protein
MTRCKRCLGCGCAATLLFLVHTVPLWAEFQVNTVTAGHQRSPKISHDPAGHFVVVWESPDGDYSGIFAQRFDADDNRAGAEFRVNSFTPGLQDAPAISHNSSGGFVIAYRSFGGGILGRRFLSTGNPEGAEFQVNSNSLSGLEPAISHNSIGGFLVVWDGEDGSGFGVFGQRFDASGDKIGGEFQVNSFTMNDQGGPAVTHIAADWFVVSWTSRFQDGSQFGVFGQRFTNGGVKAGTEFQINSVTINYQLNPAISRNLSGGFVVVWDSYQQDGPSTWGVFGQRFEENGNRFGPEFQVNSATIGSQRNAAISHDSLGNFIVTWEGIEDFSGKGISAKWFDINGAISGQEILVNMYTVDDQALPAISHVFPGGYIVAWQSLNQDGSGDGIFAQRVLRFTTTGPAAGGASKVRVFRRN